jgi:lysyl endopeptidase
MKKLCLVFLSFVLVTFFFSANLEAQLKVGEEVNETYETSHPYNGTSEVAYEEILIWPNASYISVHFSKFDLAGGDYVEISNMDGTVSYTYKGKGKSVRGGKAIISEFWATHIKGDTAIVTLHTKGSKSGYGFVIDKWAHGYALPKLNAVFNEMDKGPVVGIESICGTDDKEWAKCYDGTTMYDKAKAVCRLLINGSSACTGWLLGSEGHVMTNNHCISTQTAADNTDFEFMAEGGTCTTNCTGWLACPGIVEASSGDLIQTDSSLDYTLVLLPSNVTGTYGYLQLRDVLPTIDERIYIPQHPGAYGKQLAVYSTDSHDQTGYCDVYSTSETPCSGGPGDIGYYADTAGGSSGSPVLAYSDHLVVSLHHCAACPNRGLPIPSIISDLGSNIPANAIGSTTPPDPPAAPSNLQATSTKKKTVNLVWTDNSGNESGFRVYRGTDGVNFSLITTLSANSTTYKERLSSGVTYYYKVCAYNTAGEACSNVDSVTVL